MSAGRPRPDEAADPAGTDPARDRSDYGGSRAPTDMAIDSDDSRLERRDDR